MAREDLLLLGHLSFLPRRGDLGEILVFSKALTDGDRLAIEGYLKTHWKL